MDLLMSKRRSGKPNSSAAAAAGDVSPLTSIAEREEFRRLILKRDDLLQLIEQKTLERAALQEQQRRLSFPSLIDSLTQRFLSPGNGEDAQSFTERINIKSEEIKALGKAVELLKQELDKVRNRLSVDVCQEMFLSWRANARRVLAGMLDIQRSNDEIVALHEAIDRAGYASSTIRPVGMRWPMWGSPQDVASTWRQNLDEFLALSFIDRAEHEAITSGDLLSFRP